MDFKSGDSDISAVEVCEGVAVVGDAGEGSTSGSSVMAGKGACRRAVILGTIGTRLSFPLRFSFPISLEMF
jgi:hypothetical protein